MILNETQQAIRDAVRAFAQERIKPRSAAFEAARGYPRELFEQLAGLGVMGMTAPEEVGGAGADRSEEHTYELPSLMRTSYAVFCLKKKNKKQVRICTATTYSN